MKVLITGTSGTGKSTIGDALQKRGFDVIHTDRDSFDGLSVSCWVSKVTGEAMDMPWPPPPNWPDENDWVWRIDTLRKRLQSSNGSIVFACGDSRNKEDAYSLFDKVFVLSADDGTLRERILSRKDNFYTLPGEEETNEGKQRRDTELAWVLDQNKETVDVAKRAGGIVVDANQPLDKVINEILSQVQ